MSVNVTRALVFCVAGFLAGISGATSASLFRSSSIDTYNYVQSLLLLAVLAISGRRTVPAAVVASLLLYVVPNYIDDPAAGYWLQFSFGFFAIVAACASSGGLGRLMDRFVAASRPGQDGSGRYHRRARSPPGWRSGPATCRGCLCGRTGEREMAKTNGSRSEPAPAKGGTDV